MFSQYFGHYLLNRGYITSEQLKDALELQKSVHVKLGVLAVDEGYMTPLQVEETHLKQTQMDKRFGEIAIELGFLTNDQLEGMLTAQKQNHLLLAQALVDREYMTIEQFSLALNEYKNENSLSDDKFEAIKNGDIEVLVENLVHIETTSLKELYRDYLSLFMKNLIRFIDDQVYLEAYNSEQEVNKECFVHQEITGQTPLFTAISSNTEIFLKIASIYAEEELTEVNELAAASVSEFLNLHNGIFLVNMSNKDIELNMKPQNFSQNTFVDGIQQGNIFTVHLSKGSFNIILSENPELIQISSTEEAEVVK
ncbi:hypothetical protein SM124_00135 [Bacillus sp. 31A1R]|uniref:Chemotaxis protein CheX n=1 Tax=Robertmurraya mangrovi TaxID=3098077 RepID=A0ABU5ISL5_9BACI|nr:hypothetical protein [Bacillus sp. 31A1R]MDZ5470143.1 hypothetical protein [Bacillus sp. 31A1R]